MRETGITVSRKEETAALTRRTAVSFKKRIETETPPRIPFAYGVS